jgi:transposase-like protein
MDLSVREALSGITTVRDMVRAFQSEDRCRHLLEAMVWPTGRICPACGYRRSIALPGRENGRRARPGLYQCSSGTCRFQFTVTTRTPLHATKLPLRVWLSGLWLMLQSDKGISSIRLAEALGISQPTARRMGHALRLMVSLRSTASTLAASLGGRRTIPHQAADAKASRRPRKHRHLWPCSDHRM